VGKETGKKDPRHKHFIRQADIALDDGPWGKIATISNSNALDEMCEKKCKYFQQVSGPKVRSGKANPNDGWCRASDNEKVSWGSSTCLKANLKEYKRQGS